MSPTLRRYRDIIVVLFLLVLPFFFLLRTNIKHPEALSLLEFVGVPKALTLELPHGVTLDLTLIKPGTFQMGSPNSEPGRQADETAHSVTLDRQFYLGVSEVTQQQYEAVMGANPSQFKDPKAPVESVSWEDAQAFCEKLNALAKAHLPEGMHVKLPTEAQWERACRAGTATAFYTGNSIGADDANFNGDEVYGSEPKGLDRKRTTPVEAFKPNAFGLFDMHGNVWEWCADWYGEYDAGNGVNPSGPATGSERVLRGGAWIAGAANCRSACRNHAAAGTRLHYIGFRTAVAEK